MHNDQGFGMNVTMLGNDPSMAYVGGLRLSFLTLHSAY